MERNKLHDSIKSIILFLTVEFISLGIYAFDSSSVNDSFKKKKKQHPVVIHISDKSKIIKKENGSDYFFISSKRNEMIYEKEMNRIIKKYPNDTIIIAQNFDKLDDMCIADYVRIYKKEILISFRKDTICNKYIKTISPMSEELIDNNGFYHYDLAEIINNFREEQWSDNNINWSKYPRASGHTLYIVVHPKKEKWRSNDVQYWIPYELK